MLTFNGSCKKRGDHAGKCLFSTWHIVGVSNCWKKERIFSRPHGPFIYNLNFGFSFFFLFLPGITNPGYFAFIFYNILHITITYFIQNDPFSFKSLHINVSVMNKG